MNLLSTVVHCLEYYSIQLAVFELECCRIEGIWGDEGARGGDVVGEGAIALAEARLVAGFEVFMFDGY